MFFLLLEAKLVVRILPVSSLLIVNHLIKQEVEWKESQLPKLIDSLKAIANDELEKAVVSRGEWHLTPQYENLVVSESFWFSHMNDTAKKQHMKKSI